MLTKIERQDLVNEARWIGKFYAHPVHGLLFCDANEFFEPGTAWLEVFYRKAWKPVQVIGPFLILGLENRASRFITFPEHYYAVWEGLGLS